MGFFDFLAGIFGRNQNGATARDAIPGPRDHHYIFAHRALPSVAFSDVTQALDGFTGPAATLFLEQMWKRVGDNLRQRDRLPSNGLAHETRRDGDRVTVLVTLPPPTGMTEAWFVALAFDTSTTPPALRYLTLELGFDGPDAQPRTVLCEWTAAPSHLNMGDGPPPELEAFYQRILQVGFGSLDGELLLGGAALGGGNYAAILCLGCGHEFDAEELTSEEIERLRRQAVCADLEDEISMLHRVREFYRNYPALEGEILPPSIVNMTKHSPSERAKIDKGLGNQRIMVPLDDETGSVSDGGAIPEGAWTNDELEIIGYLRSHYFAFKPRLKFVQGRIEELQPSQGAPVFCTQCNSGTLALLEAGGFLNLD